MKATAIVFCAMMIVALFVSLPNALFQNDADAPGITGAEGTRGPYYAGYISSDQNWNGTVYVAANVTICAGVTLTIEPGTTVIFNASQHSMKAGPKYAYAWPDVFVYGAMVAQGTSAAPIVFKSDNIIALDRDNSDFFDYIWFYNGATPPTFKYCSFQFGAGCIWSNVSLTVERCAFNEFDTAIHMAAYADLTISNSTFRTNDSSSDAIFADSGGRFVLRDVTYNGAGTWMDLAKVNDVDVRRCNATTTHSYNDLFGMEECGSLNMTQTYCDTGDVGALYQYECRSVANIWDVTLINTYGSALYLDTMGPVHVYGVRGSYYRLASIDSAGDVVFDHIEIDNPDCLGGVVIDDARSVLIHNCTIHCSGPAVDAALADDSTGGITLADLDVDVTSTYGTGISLEGAKVATIKRCDLAIKMSKALYAYYCNDLRFEDVTWSVNCSYWFELSYCGKIRLNGLDAEFTGYFANIEQCGDVVLWDLDLKGKGDYAYYAIFVDGGSGFTLHNSTIDMEDGEGINASSYWYYDDYTGYVNVSDVDITTQSEDEYDCALNVESSIGAVVKDVDIVTKYASGLDIYSDGKTVAERITIDSGSQVAPFMSIGGGGDITLKDIDMTGQFAAFYLYTENGGSLTATDLDLVGGDTATGVVDLGLGTNSYTNIALLGNYSRGFDFGSGGKSVKNVEINLVQGGMGIYCENRVMDTTKPKHLELTDMYVRGGDQGLVVDSSNVTIPITTTLKNVTFEQMDFPAYFKKGAATLEDVLIADPPIYGGTAVEIDGADVKISRSRIYDYNTGIQLDTVDSKLDCSLTDIADINNGINNSIGGTLTLKDMNMLNRWISGIDSGSATTLDNVWLGCPPSRCYYGVRGVDKYFDYSSKVTLDPDTSGPIDIPGMEQRPYMTLRYNNTEQDADLRYDYLGRTVNFTIFSGDPDANDTVKSAHCNLFEAALGTTVWDDIDITGAANTISFTRSYDTGAFPDYTEVRFEAVVEFSDGGEQDYLWTFTTLQPAITDSKDGGSDGDAPGDKASARHLKTDEKFDHGAINKQSDEDWYFIESKSLKEFTVEITESTHVMVQVYDGKDNLVGSYSNANRTVKVNSPKDGVYYIKVSGNATDYYSIEVQTVKDVSILDKIMGQGWFMMAIEASIGLLITGSLAIIGIVLLSRKRRKVSRYMSLITKAYDDNRANPPKALEELTKIHKEIEDMFKSGKFEENQYLILDKKVSDNITLLRIPETQQRVAAITKENLPAPLDQQMKDVVADGVVTPAEAASVKEATEKTDIPQAKKEEVEGMVEGWKEADMNLPPPPPPPD